ncbi:hypothetical protein [Alicyclobacillus sp. ALC3]|uniref:hypothetical protein n=1 Tax=Alicyclobacillus sp. ALC3 TaxID=2796143 RepID=UPI002379642B|nr:hypothetical protein [Alicyclobacillus sp. ALC3]WDL96924.1 hypothetical protein JC200_22040 [Alicyclobacillus sp. ALC3]
MSEWTSVHLDVEAQRASHLHVWQLREGASRERVRGSRGRNRETHQVTPQFVFQAGMSAIGLTLAIHAVVVAIQAIRRR